MGRGPKPAKSKGARPPIVRKSPKDEGAGVRDLERRLAEALKREAEALEQQSATGEILRIIGSSPADAQPVFDAIAVNALRLCDANSVVVVRYDGERLHLAAHHNVDRAGIDRLKRFYPRAADRDLTVGRAVLDGAVVHVPDLQATDEFSASVARQRGARSQIAIPLLHQGRALGAIGISRLTLGPFTEQQIALLQTFANQAVIAIENVRLFNQTKEALEQQTATAEILRVISQSPTDMRPVMDAVAENAARVCGAADVLIFQLEGDEPRQVAHFGSLEVTTPTVRQVTRTTPSGRAILERRTIHIDDIVPLLETEYPSVKSAALAVGARTHLAAPLMREGASIGAILIRRTVRQPFTQKQIALLKTFADQAVIAIENVRLFTETKDALERQTATSDILRVISSSPTDAQPVFDTIARSAMRLCDGAFGLVTRYDGELLHLVAHTHVTADGSEALRRMFPMGAGKSGVNARVLLERGVVHLPDVQVDAEYSQSLSEALRLRTALAVPMLRDGQVSGTVAVGRLEVRPFTDNEIALLKTFADQAVIAIENVRLFTELQQKNEALTRAHEQVTETLDRQTATADILRVISASPTDVQPVFDAIVASATRLCEADLADLYQFDGALIHFAAQHGSTPEEIEAPRQAFPQPPGRASVSARAILDATVVQVPDVRDDPEVAEALRRLFRTVMAVPMLRDGRPIGTITVARRVVRPFSDAQTALLQTFADQAVIAIENVRLFKELEARTQELTRSVGELRALGEVGQAISSTLDLQTVLTTIVSRATHLAGMDAGVIYEYDEEREIFEPRATERLEQDIVRTLVATPIRKGEGATGRLAELREPVQVADVRDRAQAFQAREVLVRAGYRAALAVPLVRESRLLGGLTVFRKSPGEFAPEI